MGPDNELRCFCSGHPLLARVGKDELTGGYFLHVKVFKQDRIFAEVVATDGTIRVRCRNCLRWHTVRIRHEKRVHVAEEPLPDGVILESQARPSFQ